MFFQYSWYGRNHIPTGNGAKQGTSQHLPERHVQKDADAFCGRDRNTKRSSGLQVRTLSFPRFRKKQHHQPLSDIPFRCPCSIRRRTARNTSASATSTPATVLRRASSTRLPARSVSLLSPPPSCDPHLTFNDFRRSTGLLLVPALPDGRLDRHRRHRRTPSSARIRRQSHPAPSQVRHRHERQDQPPDEHTSSQVLRYGTARHVRRRPRASRRMG